MKKKNQKKKKRARMSLQHLADFFLKLIKHKVQPSLHQLGYHLTFSFGSKMVTGFIYKDEGRWVINDFDGKNFACLKLKNILEKIQPKGWVGYKTIDGKPIFHPI